MCRRVQESVGRADGRPGSVRVGVRVSRSEKGVREGQGEGRRAGGLGGSCQGWVLAGRRDCQGCLGGLTAAATCCCCSCDKDKRQDTLASLGKGGHRGAAARLLCLLQAVAVQGPVPWLRDTASARQQPGAGNRCVHTTWMRVGRSRLGGGRCVCLCLCLLQAFAVKALPLNTRKSALEPSRVLCLVLRRRA